MLRPVSTAAVSFLLMIAAAVTVNRGDRLINRLTSPKKRNKEKEMKKTRMLCQFAGAALTVAALSVSPVAAQDAVDVEMAGSSITLSPLHTSRDSALFKPTEMEGLADAAASFTDFNLSIGTDPANPAFTYDLVAGDFTTHTSSLLRYNADGVNIFCALSQQRCVVGVSGKDIDDDLASEEMSFSMSFDGTTFENYGEWMENEGAYQTTYTYLQAIEEEVVPTVTSLTGRVWMDRNLGATQVAQHANDTEAYGDLYQWGRETDGHEKEDSAILVGQAETDNPSHANFLAGSADWRNPSNAALWTTLTGLNNPCPAGFRIPTMSEWLAEIDASALAVLNVPWNGFRNTDGTLNRPPTSSYGYYWSSTTDSDTTRAYRLSWKDGILGTAFVGTSAKSFGHAVRCIKD
ncbi:hypothetical protein KKHLCK_11380 [Candidatus Electrothrix laxa]